MSEKNSITPMSVNSDEIYLQLKASALFQLRPHNNLMTIKFATNKGRCENVLYHFGQTFC